MTTPILKMPLLTHNEYNGEVTHNEALQIMDFHGQAIVIDHAEASQPVSPSEGDAYIITGAWTDGGIANDIAHYYAATWYFYTPENGYKVKSLIDDCFYIFDGTDWVADNVLHLTAPTSSSGVLDLDLAIGRVFNISLTENITSITISNAPPNSAFEITVVFTQDATGGRTVTFPTLMDWVSGTAPTITSAANAVDIMKFISVDAGVTLLNTLVNQNLS